MTEVRFYHMTKKTLNQALPEILGKALERDYKAVVKADSQEQLEDIDKFLWTYDPLSFLPHGMKKNGHEAEQPVWLTLNDNNPNKANLLVLVDGVSSEKLSEFELCCEVFDGRNEDVVKAVREHWKAYKEAGYEVSYFQQDESGKWVKK